MTDQQEIQKALEVWQAELNEASQEVVSAGKAFLGDTQDRAAKIRLDQAWDGYWQVLMGNKGLDLPEGYTMPKPPWHR